MSAYADLLARLVSARRFGMKLGLERMRELLDRLGAPDRALGTVVHLGGTNGKGSTVAMIAALAAHGGRRVATYTSPHLSCLRERVTVDGQMIDEDAFVAAAARVSAAGGDELTFFEQLTAIGMLAIAEARVDITVLEVGLGGRLDATNVVAAPVAVVTGVALDHEAILGSTIDAIAREKAGIWKQGQRAIVGTSGEPEGVPLLVAHARAAGVASVRVADDLSRVPRVALAGEHQRRNAAAALAALDELQALGAVGEVDRAAALAAVRHPGRFEVLGDVIVDGAHNPHGAHALAVTLRDRGLSPVLVLAVSADKDVRAIASALAPHVRAVIATRYQQERALEPDALAAQVAAVSDVPVETAPDLATALVAARRHGTPVVVAGSLFLAGEARVLLAGAPADPIATSDPANAATK